MISVRRLCKRSTSGLKDPQDWLVRAFGGGVETLAGTTVTEENQLSITVNLSCILLIAEQMGALRPNLYRERKSGGWDVAYDEPLQRAINIKPNDEMTGFDFREAQVINLAMNGNSYTYAPMNGFGQIKTLTPLHPHRVEKRRAKNKELFEFDGVVPRNGIVYDVTTNGKTVTVPGKKIMHVRGFSRNGLTGTALQSLQQLNFGLAMALDEYEAGWYGRGPHPALFGETDQKMSSPGLKAHKEYLEQQFSGLAKSHGFMILDQSIKIKEIMPRLDWAMLDEAQKRMATTICGLWRVPPSLIGILDRATFNNISHLDRQFGKYCMHFWTEKHEQQMMCSLLTDEQLSYPYKIEFPMEDIYKADFEALNKALKEAWDRGIISKNEWRSKIGMNPAENGNLFYVPSNFEVEGSVKNNANSNDDGARIVPIRSDGAI